MKSAVEAHKVSPTKDNSLKKTDRSSLRSTSSTSSDESSSSASSTFRLPLSGSAVFNISITPNSSPLSSPVSSPVESPLGTPFTSPLVTPFSTPGVTPLTTPGGSPLPSPGASPVTWRRQVPKGDRLNRLSRDSNNNQSGTLQANRASRLVVKGERKIPTGCVAIYKEDDGIVVLKVNCKLSLIENPAFRTLISKTAQTCFDYQNRKPDNKMILDATEIQDYSMDDDRSVKEHVEQFSLEEETAVSIDGAVFLATPQKGYIGTCQGSNEVAVNARCTVSHVGIAVALRRKNKFAPVEEFSKQLCHHVAKTRPTDLGISDENQWRPKPAPCCELVNQAFTYDTSINVGEAARRSMIDICDYVLYE